MTRDELIAALERAEGPSLELDEEITRVAIWRNKVDRSVPVDRPPYTASIDAALTLYVRRPDRVPTDPRLACIEALRQQQEACDA